jgi:hypothetical protein
MYEVRFHLGKGKNFRSWQVKGPHGTHYYDPEANSLVLRDCTLTNRKSVAEKVNKTQKRDVCGYVRCKSVEVAVAKEPPEGRVVHFDPKIVPYWVVEGKEGPQDGLFLPTLVSHGRRLRDTSGNQCSARQLPNP